MTEEMVLFWLSYSWRIIVTKQLWAWEPVSMQPRVSEHWLATAWTVHPRRSLLFVFSDEISLGSCGWYRTHFIGHADLELVAIPPHPSECWEYWCVPPCPTNNILFV